MRMPKIFCSSSRSIESKKKLEPKLLEINRINHIEFPSDFGKYSNCYNMADFAINPLLIIEKLKANQIVDRSETQEVNFYKAFRNLLIKPEQSDDAKEFQLNKQLDQLRKLDARTSPALYFTELMILTDLTVLLAKKPDTNKATLEQLLKTKIDNAKADNRDLRTELQSTLLPLHSSYSLALNPEDRKLLETTLRTIKASA